MQPVTPALGKREERLKSLLRTHWALGLDYEAAATGRSLALNSCKVRWYGCRGTERCTRAAEGFGRHLTKSAVVVQWGGNSP